MFAIIRAHKHKSIASISRSARHTFREQPTLNADSTMISKNRFTGCRGTENLLGALCARLPERRRKDAVLCIEYLVTASPGAFSRHGGHLDELGTGYFADALSWLKARHGQDNILSAAVHLDEMTPHLVVYVVPMTKDGRLSAREFLGGPKIMRDMQDSFYNSCGLPHGLQRGISGSKAHHTAVSQFYTALQADEPSVKLAAKDYIAKALGYETIAWKKAQAQAKRIAQQATVDAIQRQALFSRAQALVNIEKNTHQNALQVQEYAQTLAKREASLVKREQVLAKRAPDLDRDIARSERAEQLLEMYEHRISNEPNPSRKLNHSLIPAL